MKQHDYDEIVADLDRYEAIPDDVLAELVARDGLCFWAFDRSEMPELSGEDTPDRELAAGMCAGCPVIDECLELELRSGGANTIGVWGARTDTDRREIHQVWKTHRSNANRGDQR